MYRFYNFGNFWKIAKIIFINFPLIVFISTPTIVVGRVRYISSAFNLWNRKYFRNYALRFGGYFIVKNWFKRFRKDTFLVKLDIAKKTLSGKNTKNPTGQKNSIALHGNKQGTF